MKKITIAFVTVVATAGAIRFLTVAALIFWEIIIYHPKKRTMPEHPDEKPNDTQPWVLGAYLAGLLAAPFVAGFFGFTRVEERP